MSGSGALSYMNLDKFKKENIKVYVSDFKQEPYKQLWEKQQGFIKNLSIIDLLFNNFEHTLDYIQKSGNISRII